MHTETREKLAQTRNTVLAKSLYRQLKGEGFSHEQIIELSGQLLELVTRDLQQPQPA